MIEGKIGTFRDQPELLDIEHIQGKGWCCCVRNAIEPGSVANVGCYGTISECIVARDMEVMKMLGRKPGCGKLLNKEYNIRYENETMESFEVEIMHGIWIAVNPTIMSEKILNNAVNSVFGRRGVKEFSECSSVFTKSGGYLYEHKSWAEMITTSYIPITNFVFEITFNHNQSLGLNLKSHYVPFGKSDSLSIGCLMVVSVQNPYLAQHNVVRPGDIILQINETSLVNTAVSRKSNEPSIPQTFSFESKQKQITTAKHPRVMRFLRLASICSFNDTTRLSPAELEVYMSPNYQYLSAKYVSTATSIQLVYINPLCPYSIKKMVQGGAMQWKMLLNGGTSQPPPGPGGLVGGSMTSVSAVGSKRNSSSMSNSLGGSAVMSPQAKIMTKHPALKAVLGTIAEGTYDSVPVGVYRESLTKHQGCKFVAQIQVPPPSMSVSVEREQAEEGCQGRFFYIGTYDTEEEATSAYALAVKEITSCGQFIVKAQPVVPTPKASSSGGSHGHTSSSSSSSKKADKLKDVSGDDKSALSAKTTPVRITPSGAPTPTTGSTTASATSTSTTVTKPPVVA